MPDQNGETNGALTEQQAGQAHPEQAHRSEPAHVDTMTAKIIYILYLLSLLTGITGIVGVITAYVKKNEGPDWLQNHYRFQIRTFWIGLLYGLIGFLLTAVFIGFLVLLAVVVLFIVRCAIGWKYLTRGEPVPNAESWFLGT